MEASSPRQFQKPFRASSEGPIPPARSAREDGDASATRKRPRLDSGDRTYRSLSAEAPSANPETPSLSFLKHSLSKDDASSKVVNDLPQPTTSPRSKVTLNIKEQPTTFKQDDIQMEPESISSHPQPEIPDSQEIPTRTQSLSPQPQTPSELGSPEIEVAEPEDATGYLGPTIWTRPGERSIESRRQILIETFPLLQDTENWGHVLQRICNILQWNDNDIGSLLDNLSEFIDQWIELADECPQKIWELWNPDTELWTNFHLINEALLRRTVPATIIRSPIRALLSNSIDLTEDDADRTRQANNQERIERDPLLQFLRRVVAVLSRLLQMDRQTLIETANDAAEPDLGGKSFVTILNTYSIGGIHNHCREFLWRTYSDARWNTETLLDVLMMELLHSNGIDNLVDCTSFLMERSPTDLEYAASLVMTAAGVLQWSSRAIEQFPEMAARNYRVLSQLYFKCADKFEESIKKQAAGFTIEVIQRFVSGLSECLKYLCVLNYKQTIQLLPPHYDQEIRKYLLDDATTNEYAIELVTLEMKLETAFLCMRNGRMESRVAGVEAFGDLLLNVYKRYHNHRQEGQEINLVVAFCKDFIRERDLISHLVGVDSHPQIVSRSKNIIGFQVATHNFSRRDTDTIWAAMRSSQDPRRSEAIMDVLMAQVEYSEATFLQSFAEKLVDLPLDAYDNKMRNFTKQLLHAAPRAAHHDPPLADMMCTKILIPILQNCLRRSSLSLKEKTERWHFALTEFRTAVATAGISEEAKSQFSVMAVRSIEEGGYASTAGIAVLGILIEGRYCGYEYGGRPFCMTERFAELIVNDLGQCAKVLQETHLEEVDISEILRPRIDLIERCLQSLNFWPYEAYTEELWQNLVGNGAINNAARDLAFRMFARLMHGSTLRRIKFLDDCIQQYFQRLDSHNIIPSVLDFGKEASAYYERFLRKSAESDLKLTPLPGDIFWHIALLAENQDIAEKATKFFVQQNLVQHVELSSTSMEKNHVRLVDRCVAELTTAANKVNHDGEGAQDPKPKIASDSLPQYQNSNDRLRFSRSLYVLKQFLIKIREQRLGSPVIRNDSPLSDHSIHGEEIKFSFYKFPPQHTVKQVLAIGSESTLKDLVERLGRAVGYTQIKIIAAGMSIDLEQNLETPLGDISLLSSSGPLLIAKGPEGRSLKEEKYNSKLLPLEQQVLIHFDKLYDLLNLNDEMGREACTFLMTFPPKQEILSKPPAELLCLELPYKSIYSCYAMKKKLSLTLSEGVSCDDDLGMIVKHVGDALVEFIATSDNYFTSPASLLLFHMTDCLDIALKETVSDQVAKLYFSDAPLFVQSILKLLEAALESNLDTNIIVRYCFSIALEACFKSREAWMAFKSYGNITEILHASWLSASSNQLRVNATQAVKGICAALPHIKTVDPVDFLDFFWQQILLLVPKTLHVPNQATQFFDVAMNIFRSASEYNSLAVPLNDYVWTWSDLLLNHRPQGSLPNKDQDTVIDGLADMLLWALQSMKSKHQSIDGAWDLLEAIFTMHVFPCNMFLNTEHDPQLYIPVLSSLTRSKLYNLLTSLTIDQDTLKCLIAVLGQIVPDRNERNGSWSSGVAQPLIDVADPLWIIERDKIVRTEPGYAGLKNLSNTCYLNSLFEQLFMNTRFRDFMLHAKVIDRRNQVLLYETQKLFSYQQETWLKCVDPSNVVENILNFDSEPIDIHNQMDVDEFYNVLFDRWENQLSSPEEKQAFRKFYGGELVQQIKSEDCNHVSERIEPFSVIQCEIQGKSGLADSLNAFIEGEMMQGDNKYKCSSCDTYVNAVKRACLKNVPDNLIFHLKRFDYDLVHGTRHKINDQFEFPMEIDLAPYNVEYLQDPRTKPKPDKFMLVGILVHSGTAEVGHYYSFIRERPGIKDTWVEMNDAEVSAFDPAMIPHNCFGGFDQSTTPGWSKSYNAYMLFYQRTSSMVEDASTFPTNTRSPVKTEIPVELYNQLVSENELWIRKYCLLDPSYVKFSRDVLDRYRDLYQEQCSEGHLIEAKIIEGTVRQFELVFARVKDLKFVDELLRSLERILRRCSTCMHIFLRSMTTDGTFRNLLFRCPQEIIKQRLAEEILYGLNMLKEHDPVLYEGRINSPSSPSSDDNNVYDSTGAFQEVLMACDHIIDSIPLLTRGWDDFWTFLCKLGRRGKWELSQIQEHQYFTRALQVISYNGGVSQVPEWTFANNYLKHRARKRYNMSSIARLSIMLFQGYLDSLVDMDHDRSDIVHVNDFEAKVLTHCVASDPKNRAPSSVVLAGFLAIHDLEPDLYSKIMLCYMRFNTSAHMLKAYQTSLLKGASVSPASLANPYLIAALVFSEYCPDDRIILFLVSRLAEAVQSIGDDGGEEHYRFFARLSQINNRHLTNYDPPLLKQTVIKKLHLFAPHLLCYYEAEPRTGTTRLVDTLILDVNIDALENEEEVELITSSGKQLIQACLRKLEAIIEARTLFDITRLDALLDVIRLGLNKFFNNDLDIEEYTNMQIQFNRYTDAVPHIAAQSPDGIESAEYSDSDELTDISVIPG